MEITKEQLKEMYKTMSNKELAEKLGVTIPTLLATLKRCGIKLKGKGNTKTKRNKLIIID